MAESEIEKSYVRTAQGYLHVRTCGQGPTFVLLQVLPFGCAMLEPLMRALAQRDCHSIAIDLMGYGNSDRRNGSWRVEDFADNIAEALDVLNASPVLLLGGHFSALVAADLSLRHPRHAPRLALDGVPAWTSEERQQRSEANVGALPLDDSGDAVLARWKRTVAILRRADPDQETGAANEAAYLDAFRAFLALEHKPGPEDAFFGFDTEAALKSLRVPVMVIGSQTDTLRAFHERAFNWIPKADGKLWQGTNPLYYMTRPCPDGSVGEYAGILASFANLPDA